jgi:putative ABC transport system permease protein
MMEAFFKDLKHSLRMFGQSPGFTIAAVAALAIGIGADTAIFSVIDTVLLRPVPYPESDRVVMFTNTFPGGEGGGASPTKFNVWRQQTSAFEDVSAYRFGPINLTGVDQPEQVQSAQTSVNYFRLFGYPVARGRTYTADEDRPGGNRVAVLSDALWKRRFGGDPAIIGKTLSLAGNTYEVIGITAPGYRTEVDPPTEVWIPFQIDPNTIDQGNFFNVAGRLKPGITLGMAKAQIQLVANEFRRKYPAALGPQNGFSAQRMQDALIGNIRSSLYIFAGAVSFVLLIACANVANLLLVRATRRKREIAIRAAVGAGRGRIIRQLLTESVTLSLAGGVVGLIVGSVGIRALLAVNPGNIPRIGPHAAYVGIDWRVLTFTVLISLLTGILFGLIPALQASRADLSLTLKESSGRSGTGFRQNKARSLLIISEMTLALILLVGAALLIRTFLAIRSVNPGFDSHNVLTLRMSINGPQFQKTAGVSRLVRNGLEQLRALPGVAVATAACCVPLEGGYGLPFVIVGRPTTNGPFHGGGGWYRVGPGFFEAFKIPVLRGRAITERDEAGTAPVVIINQAMAKQYWPKSDPLNDRLLIGGRAVGPAFSDEPRQIIGVVGDLHDGGLNRDPRPAMYVPQTQMNDSLTVLDARIYPLAWIVRTQVEPHSLSAAIQRELRQASGGLPVATIRTMDEVVVRSTAAASFNTLLLTVFGCSALLLAAIGIYGLMAYSVQQRTQEIGIRMALGAGSDKVRNMVVLQGMRLALIGVALGIGGAFALTRLIASFLFGVKALDPMVFSTVPLLLIAVALFSTWLPARRAARINPLDALRYE